MIAEKHILSFSIFSAVNRHCNTDEAVWSAGAIAVA